MKRQPVLLLLLFLLCQCCTAANNNWYEPHCGVFLHNNDPDFSFLIGTWRSIDPKVRFTECWHRSATGMLTGIRTELTEYDLIAFEPTPTGARVHMRRMSAELQGLKPESLDGGWRIPTAHRGSLHCSDADNKIEIVSSYDSPSPDLLNLEIETKTKTTEKLIVHMRRVK